MKNFIIYILAFLLTAEVFGQAPEKFTYQAVVRDANGALLANSNVDILLGILQGSATGTIVFEESHSSATTNANGLVTLEIGTGTPVIGSVADIDWGDGPYFLVVETTVNGAIISASSELLSVPYALHATGASQADSSGYADDAGQADFADSTSYADEAGVAQDVVSQKEFILITPGMVSPDLLRNGATYAIAPTLRSCIDLPDGNNNNIELSVSVPVPANYTGTGIRIRVLYTFTDLTGDISMTLGAGGNELGTDLTPFTGGGSQTVSPPSALNELQEITQFVSGFGLNGNPRLLQILIRRQGANAADTNTGDFRIFGIALEYDN